MPKFINILLSLWLVAVAFSAQSAVAERDFLPDFTIHRITRYLPELQHITRHFTSRDLVIFDLDNTIFRETQQLGTDEWYSYFLDQALARGLSREAAVKEMEPLNLAIKHRTAMRLMEPEVPQFIRDLQARGVLTIGLTARHPALADSTLRNLKNFDIDFSRSQIPPEKLQNFSVPGLKNAFLYKGGVMFSDGAKKGKTVKHMLMISNTKIEHMAGIDDRIHHVESYVETVQDLEIKGALIHYLRVLEEPPFEPETADIQLRVFQKLGLILSDQEAAEFIERNPDLDDYSLSWECSRLLTRI